MYEDKNLGIFNNTVHGTFSVQYCNPLFCKAVYKNLAVCVKKQTPVLIVLLSRQSSFFTYHIFFTQHHKINCAVKYLIFP